MKVVFTKDDFHVFFQISTKFLDGSRFYKRQLSHVSSILLLLLLLLLLFYFF
jgi:hypothetical protein